MKMVKLCQQGPNDFFKEIYSPWCQRNVFCLKRRVKSLSTVSSWGGGGGRLEGPGIIDVCWWVLDGLPRVWGRMLTLAQQLVLEGYNFLRNV